MPDLWCVYCNGLEWSNGGIIMCVCICMYEDEWSGLEWSNESRICVCVDCMYGDDCNE